MSQDVVNPVVVICRFADHSKGDLIAIVATVDDVSIKLEMPYFILIGSTGMTLQPYCLYSDERTFTFKRDTFEFVVPASETISASFFRLLDQMDTKEEDEQVDSSSMPPVFVNGNDWKH